MILRLLAGMCLGLLLVGDLPARSVWMVDAASITRVELQQGDVTAIPRTGEVHAVASAGAAGAWMIVDDALVLFDATLAQRVRVPLRSALAPGQAALAAQMSDGSAWIAAGGTLLHVLTDGSIAGESVLDEPVSSIAVAGPDAIFMASASALRRIDGMGNVEWRADLAALPGQGPAALLLDPLAGYVWLAREGALVQFDVLASSARLVIVTPQPDAMSVDPRSGVLTSITGRQLARYDRDGKPVFAPMFVTEPLLDLAGVDRHAPAPLLWFGDRAGFGAIDLVVGAVLRVPGTDGIRHFGTAPPRIEPVLQLGEHQDALLPAGGQLLLGASVLCDGMPCVASPGYLQAMRLRTLAAGHDASTATAPLHPRIVAGQPQWSIDHGASPSIAWLTDAYGNPSVPLALPARGTPVPATRGVTAKAAPTIAITAPLDHATFTAPLNTTIKATATPGTGATVAKVEFLSNGALLGSATVSPHGFTWSNVQVGSYVVTAKVTDTLGATAASAPISVSVTPGVAASPMDAWLFNDAWASAGVAADSVSTHNATPTGVLGAVASGASKPKPDTCKAASFGGGAMDIAGLTLSTAAGTRTSVAFWMNWNGTDGAAVIGWARQSLWFGSGSFGFGTGNGDVFGLASTGLANRWVHVVAEFANGSVSTNKLYLDGVPQVLAQRLGAPLTANAVVSPTLRLGGLAGVTTSRFGGTLDEVKLFNRALTATQVSAEFAAANPCGAAPAVSLTAPATGSTFVAPAAVQLTATASATASGAVVRKVEFYNGTTLLGTSTAAPYAFAWKAVPAGSYTVKAKATDSRGSIAFSAVSSIAVKANVVPKVTLTSPAAGSTFNAPATISLAATATDGDGTVTKVDFYNGTTRIGTAATPPYLFTWSNVAGGTWSLTAKATDDRGGVGTSTAVSVKVNKPPTAAVTAPANNATIVLPATVTIKASATDADGSVGKVEFLRDGVLLGADASSPYSYTWSGMAPGTYVLTARSTDNSGVSTTSAPVTVTVKNNAAPAVSITAPANGASLVSGVPVSITAAASDADGKIARVAFHVDDGTDRLLGTAAAPPYAVTQPLAAGTNVLTAVAFDDKGASTTSAPVTVAVKQNALPSVVMTSPASDQIILAPSMLPDVRLAATASDSDGTVRVVKFYKLGPGDTDPVLLGSVATPPYEVVWQSVPYGEYGVWAEATDNAGDTDVSGHGLIVAATEPASPYGVNITSPVPFRSSVQFRAPATVVVTAVPQGPTATGVELLVDGVPVDRSTTPNGPSGSYLLSWRDAPAGTYALTARSFDSYGRKSVSSVLNLVVDGGHAVSPAVTLTAPVEGQFVPRDTPLSLSATLSDPSGTVSRLQFLYDYEWIGWSTTPPFGATWTNVSPGTHRIAVQALNGYADPLAESFAYVITPLLSRYPAAVITSPAASSSHAAGTPVTMTVEAVPRDGAITRVDFYEGISLLGSRSAPPYTVDAYFPGGVHSIRAYVDSVSRGAFTSPVTFSVAGTGAGSSIVITAPRQNERFAFPATVQVTAEVVDPANLVDQVTFYEANAPLAVVRQPPWSATLADLAGGSHTMTAAAHYRTGGSIGAAPVSFSIVLNSSPQVALVSPAAGASIAVGQPVTLAATATDSDGSITKVELFAGTTLVGTVTAPPYAATWTPSTAGNYSLTAKATDDLGGVTTSSAVVVTVRGNALPSVSVVLPQDRQRLVPGAVDLLATASDADGSIARVDFYAGTTLVASAPTKPFAASWPDVAAGTYAITAVAVDNAGATVRSSPVTLTVAPVSVSLMSPADGAAIPADFVLVRGTYDAPPNSGVTVNGIVAASDGTNFFVNAVPLYDGPNAIEITVTTETGLTTRTSITVNRTAAAVLHVEASADELLGPGTVTLSALWSTDLQPTALLIENFGTASIDNTIFDGNRLARLSFASPGLYLPKVTVTDSAGNAYTQQVAILVLDKGRLDGLLRAVWDGASRRLAAQDVAGALRIATPGARSRYQAVLGRIASALPAAVASWEPPSGGDLSLQVSEYSIRRIINGVKKRYFIYLIKDGDGVWRLESM
jgi:hypothetical protein